MQKLATLGALAGLTLLLGAAPDSGPVVHISNFAFKPPSITVAAGQRVTFVNDDEEPHTVTAAGKTFDSEGLDLHGSWQHVFTKPGTYAYICSLHPFMKGTVVVTAGDGGNH
jgi:plastocyanin